MDRKRDIQRQTDLQRDRYAAIQTKTVDNTQGDVVVLADRQIHG